jgi:hypothetical protein
MKWAQRVGSKSLGAASAVLCWKLTKAPRSRISRAIETRHATSCEKQKSAATFFGRCADGFPTGETKSFYPFWTRPHIASNWGGSWGIIPVSLSLSENSCRLSFSYPARRQASAFKRFCARVSRAKLCSRALPAASHPPAPPPHPHDPD